MQGITVNEVLALLADRGVQLIAGAAGAGRVVRHVSVLEIDDYDQWVRGGELFLTTMRAFRPESARVHLVENLHSAGAAALAVHPGTAKGCPVTPAVTGMADRLGMPLLMLPAEMAYITVFSEVLGTILNREAILLERAQRINASFMRVLLKGGGPEDIARSLASLIQKRVIITDSRFAPSIVATPVGESARMVSGIGDHDGPAGLLSRVLPAGFAGRYRFRAGGRLSEAVVRELDVTSTAYHYVVVLTEFLDYEETPEERQMEELALAHAADALALENAKLKALLATEMRVNYEFLDSLFGNRFSCDEEALMSARAIGLDFRDKHVVIVLTINNLTAQGPGGTPWANRGVLLREKARDIIGRVLGEEDLLFSRSDGFVLLPDLTTGPEIAIQACEKLAHSIQAAVADELQGASLSAGIGGYHAAFLDLAKSYQEALKAAALAQRLGQGGIRTYNRFGIYEIIGNSESETLREFCAKRLAPLLEHDRRKGTSLVQTLEVFMDHQHSVVQTARKMFLHPNTVKYRIGRIKELLGPQVLEDDEERLGLYVAVKARNLM